MKNFRSNVKTNKKSERNEKEFKKKLSNEQFNVLRCGGTESPFTSPFLKEKRKGEFVCTACGNVLFDSKTKFDSGTGWPSFYDAKKGSVKFNEDNSLGMNKTEVLCAKCMSHLGHLFNDQPVNSSNPTGKRYCINGLALGFNLKKQI